MRRWWSELIALLSFLGTVESVTSVVSPQISTASTSIIAYLYRRAVIIRRRTFLFRILAATSKRRIVYWRWPIKRGTPGHPKTLALAADLGLEPWGAVGVLESVWHFAAHYARRGDVGRRSNVAIAQGIGWRGDADRLIAALVLAGYLDECACHRLRVHDWPDHADQAVRKTSDVRVAGFIECYPSSVKGIETDSGRIEEGRKRIAESGTQPSPEQGTGNREQGNGTGNRAEGYVRAIWAEHCRRRGSELPEASAAEFDLMRSWREQGIPVRVVLRGLEDTKVQKPNLGYYGPSVAEAADRWRKAVPS